MSPVIVFCCLPSLFLYMTLGKLSIRQYSRCFEVENCGTGRSLRYIVKHRFHKSLRCARYEQFSNSALRIAAAAAARCCCTLRTLYGQKQNQEAMFCLDCSIPGGEWSAIIIFFNVGFYFVFTNQYEIFFNERMNQKSNMMHWCTVITSVIFNRFQNLFYPVAWKHTIRHPPTHHQASKEAHKVRHQMKET